MEHANRELLLSGLTQLGLQLADDRIERLVAYHDALMEWNSKVNLTGLKDERDSVIKNLLNALGPWRQIHPTKTTADIGSGGGLPGIPLAIALDMPAMTLIESKRKKCDFLEHAVAVSGVPVRVLCSDAAQIRERFVQVVSCALGTLSRLLQLTHALRDHRARLLLWKGRRERIDEELAECSPKQRAQWTLIPFSVPLLEGDAERHLAVWSDAG